MSKRKAGEYKWQMMELPDGITTSNGNWYHITSEQIENYTPGLLKKYPIQHIIKEADAWVKSADGLSLFLYFVLIYLSTTPWIACLISLVFFLVWYFNTSAFLNLTVSLLVKLLTSDGFVYIVSSTLLIGIVFTDSLSTYGIYVEFNAIWYGIALFFLFKVGLMRLFIKFIHSRSANRKVEMPDRILNMLLIRYGIKSGILTGKINEMQDRLLDVVNYHKTRKKKKF